MRTLLINLWHDKIPVLAVFLTVLGGAVALSRGFRPMFEAEGRLLVLPGQEYSSPPVALEGAPAGNLVSDQLSKAEIEILGQFGAKRTVAERLGPRAIYADLPPGGARPGEGDADRAARRIAAGLTIEPQADSSVVRMRFRHADPEMAARVINALIEVYLADRVAIYDRDPSAALVARRDADEAEAAAARARLATFEAGHGLTDAVAEINLLLQQRARLRLRRLQSDQAAADARAHEERLTASIRGMPDQVLLAIDQGSEPENGNSHAALLSLRLRRQELLSKYTETSGYIQDLDRQIEAVRAFDRTVGARVSRASNMGQNPAVAALRLDLDAAVANGRGERAKAAELDAQADAVEARLAGIAPLAMGQTRARRELAQAETRARVMAGRADAAAAAAAFDRQRAGNVRVTQAAAPGRPVGSGRALVLGAGVLIATVLSAATAGLRASLRQTLLTPGSAARQTGQTLLATAGARR